MRMRPKPGIARHVGRASRSRGSLARPASTGSQIDHTVPSATMLDVILKRFDAPDEVRTMMKGRFEIVRLAGMTIGRATYEPGWRWSLHVGPGVGAQYCTVEHVGMVVSGTATAAFEDGRIVPLRAGELFHIPATPHDSWVVGNEPYVSIHFLGADHYAR